MMMDNLIDNSQSIIITLDVDELLFAKLEKIAQAGYSVVEINSVDQNLLTKAMQSFPMLRIGAGNIIDTQQLENCYHAGVAFITSPGFLPAIAQTANLYSINYLPGVATLSEAMQAMALGCHHVRPYPANFTLCKMLNKSLPLMRLFPAEVNWEQAEHYLGLPAVTAVSVLNPEMTRLHSVEMA